MSKIYFYSNQGNSEKKLARGTFIISWVSETWPACSDPRPRKKKKIALFRERKDYEAEAFYNDDDNMD